ncbi:hypothetical protein CUJ84_Chr004005 [Rhizobium leguminosarum]|uniref:Uncharacterized protein n=1 Tax=Rhizobium leguminosarum TaxID=384 RepID=A0A2K9Z7V3_RHILE|nr:hypothetical protein CUJ84_Chr004005 [Rhizobium leguminosarum]
MRSKRMDRNASHRRDVELESDVSEKGESDYIHFPAAGHLSIAAPTPTCVGGYSRLGPPEQPEGSV